MDKLIIHIQWIKTNIYIEKNKIMIIFMKKFYLHNNLTYLFANNLTVK
jgi:hypothetical protein